MSDIWDSWADDAGMCQTGEVGVFFEASIHRNPLLFNNIITASMNLVYVAFLPIFWCIRR